MKSVAFRRPLVRFLVRFLMAVNGLLLLGSILNACLLPRLASGAAARFEERTGLALVIERPSYDPFRGLRAATVTIGDGVVLQKLRLKPAGLPRPHRLVAILSSLAAPFDETSLSWLEQPWLALGELKAAGALPRSLSVGSFTLPAAALGGAGGELQGSLSMAFRRGAAELSVTMDGPLKAKLAARVDLDGRTGELSLAASSTGLKPAALPLPAPLAFSLDLRVGSAGTDSARADSARAGSAGTDGVADAAPWLLDGTLSFALDPYQGSYAFSALLDPAARESIPMPPERAYNPAQLPAGSLRFTKGELRLDGLAAGSLAVGSLIMEIRPSWTGQIGRASCRERV